MFKTSTKVVLFFALICIVGDTGAPPLQYWHAALHNCRNQVVDVNVHGTSRSINDITITAGTSGLSVTFPNRWTNRLEELLQSMCGSHGSGLVPFRWGTGNFAVQGLNRDFFTTGGGASFTATDTTIGPHQGSDSMVITAVKSRSSIRFNTLHAFDHLRLYCTSGPGLNSWAMTIDGVDVGRCGGSAGSRTAVLATSSAVSLGKHVAEVSCPTQPCSAYGIEVTSGTTGVSVNNLSVGGASAEVFALTPSQYAYENLIPDPVALDIIEQGCNEFGNGITPPTFRRTLDAAVAHDRALRPLPASTLIVAELQDVISGQAPYYLVVTETAQRLRTGYVDMRDRWGFGVAPAFLFGPDRTHESNAGNSEVFRTVASAIFDAPPSRERGSPGSESSPVERNGK